ncbi:MAG: PEP-CTERM sorting domain-containing protein [Planctomycetia bacterium]|nr:PEP-CTERM sorting domain-containing protein [Planctomycetia bacterium]
MQNSSMARTRPKRWLSGAGWLLALCVLCGSAAGVRAGQWSYEWVSNNDKIIFGGGINELNLTAGPSGTTSGNQSILGLLLDIEAPFHGTSDSFVTQNYSLTLRIKDLDSNEQSGPLTFGGNLSGSATADSTNFINNFVAPTEIVVPLGDVEYKVTIGPFAKPGPAGGASGTIHAFVEVLGERDPTGPNNPPTHETPEPGTLVLAGLAAACSGAAAVRKRWKTRATQQGA